MAYVPVPKDLTKIKTKVMLNLTKRQLISFGSGALLGVPLFFLAKPHMSVSTAALLMWRFCTYYITLISGMCSVVYESVRSIKNGANRGDATNEETKTPKE